MDKFVYVKSDQSDDYFLENRVWKFKVHLDVPMAFDGFWKLALVEFNARLDKKVRKSPAGEFLFVYTNLCKESIVHGTEQPILRKMKKNASDGWDIIFDTPIYVPLKRKEVQEFEVYIKSEDGTLASFLESPVNLTLHFKRYPFYADYESL
jgi:hypothetical protein